MTTIKNIVVANNKGGVGKTTASLQLSILLANRKQRVLAIDLDSRGDFSRVLGVEGIEDLYDVGDLVVGDCDDDRWKCVQKTVHPLIQNIPGGYGMNKTESIIRHQRGNTPLDVLREKLSTFTPEYDCLVFDCKPDADYLTLSGVAMATHIVIPVECSYMGLGGMVPLVEAINLIRMNSDRAYPKVIVLPTKYNYRTKSARDALKAVSQFCDQFEFDIAPPLPSSIVYDRAMYAGKPVDRVKGGEYRHVYPYEKVIEKIFGGKVRWAR